MRQTECAKPGAILCFVRPCGAIITVLTIFTKIIPQPYAGILFLAAIRAIHPTTYRSPLKKSFFQEFFQTTLSVTVN